MKQPIDAVTLRYDLIDIETLDRERAKEIVDAVRQWADKHINLVPPS
jgi:hypothetical protein